MTLSRMLLLMICVLMVACGRAPEPQAQVQAAQLRPLRATTVSKKAAPVQAQPVAVSNPQPNAPAAPRAA